MGFDLKTEAMKLSGLPLAALQTEFERAGGRLDDTIRDDRIYLVRRILFMRQHEHERSSEEIERRRREKEIAREQEEALGVVKGTHCILACDCCRAEVVVPVLVRHALKRDRERGGPSRFLCSECQDKDFRRAHEREGLERTRKQIEAERARRRRAEVR